MAAATCWIDIDMSAVAAPPPVQTSDMLQTAHTLIDVLKHTADTHDVGASNASNDLQSAGIVPAGHVALCLGILLFKSTTKAYLVL